MSFPADWSSSILCSFSSGLLLNYLSFTMPAPTVFCSHCGVPQLVESTSGGFALHCASCGGLSIGVAGGWSAVEEQDGTRLPLPPLLRYEENEFACTTCDASLSVELVMRGPGIPCPQHSQPFAKSTEAKQPTRTTLLSPEEMAFFTSTPGS